MSFKQNTLVLIALPDELRIVEACPGEPHIYLRNATTLHSDNHEPDAFVLSDPKVVAGLRDVVTANSWGGRKVICLVAGTSVSCQYYDVPPLKGPALRQAVELKLGQQLHFDVAQAIVAIEEPKRSDGEQAVNRVSVTAVHKDITETVIRELEQVDLQLMSISAAPASLTWMARELMLPRNGLVAALYIDERQSTLIVANEGVSCVTSELPIGAAEFTASLMRPIIAGENVIQLEEKQAREIRDRYGVPSPQQEIKSLQIRGDRLLPLLEPALQKLTKQLTQWISFASTTASGAKLESLMLVGPGAHLPGLADAITSRIRINARLHDWLADQARMAEAAPIGDSAEAQEAACFRKPIEIYAAAFGAVKASTLPDLLPPDIKRARLMNRIRMSVSICSPIVAAATLVFAVLFQRVGDDISGEVAARQQQLASVAQIVDENSKWVAQQERINRLEKAIDDFSRASPNWTGIFKELSFLLPHELHATRYSASSSGENLALNVTATVYANNEGRSFDEIVSQTLLLLQRSAFFSRVELLSANRLEQANEPGSSGVLNLRLDLVYPRLKAKV